MRKVIIESLAIIIIFLLLVVIVKSCPRKIDYLLGERIVELKVKNSKGSYSSIFLKGNRDVLTISETPDMKYIALQENSAVQYGPIFLYKNTKDTLYLVWWSRGSGYPKFETDAIIQFIYEPDISPDLVQKYISLGFIKFPEDAYK